ncbi:MAG: SDR family NAD(P)-dependent oxidoreductase, partial [Clostridiales bacterium]|nr:SDR family NAD(P)-dependent oxidoreductase [Clostridiales bacterium]
MSLSGKVIVITGGAGPIGREACLRFLQEGARLVIGWYYVEEWQDTEPLLSEYKDQYVSVKADFTTEDGAMEIIKAAVVNYGKLDCLVNT